MQTMDLYNMKKNIQKCRYRVMLYVQIIIQCVSAMD